MKEKDHRNCIFSDSDREIMGCANITLPVAHVLHNYIVGKARSVTYSIPIEDVEATFEFQFCALLMI